MKKVLIFLFILLLEVLLLYEISYKDEVYPGVVINERNFGGWKKKEVENFFVLKNKDFYKTKFVFSFEEKVATVSGEELNWGYNAKEISNCVFEIGRSGALLSNLQVKIKTFFRGVTLKTSYHFDEEKLREILSEFNQEVYLPPINALFQFKNGRVIAFQKEKEGRTLDIEKAIQEIKENLGKSPQLIKIELNSHSIKPEITIDEINNLGISELLGKGVSYFWGSSPSRIHNIVLSTSRLNGVLIKPEEIFSFNQSLGDVSPVTGYQQAYIIKEGKTILGDGGGVCQVSTTLFRAALNAGLPIIERWPHSYRVSYYEQGGFGPGLDATVFLPSIDLKFRNNSPARVLIQAYVNTKTKTLSFELYGTSDGRKTTISKPNIWEQTPPPEDFYKDEPSLPRGVIKQIERKAWGAKVSFDWKIERAGEIIDQKTFFSFYQPWQAVYLRGVGE